jgi:hypothetical protein
MGGEKSPMITSYVLDALPQKRPLSFTQRVERVLRFISTRTGVGESLPLYRQSNDELSARLMAWSESASQQELSSLLNVISEMGLIQLTPTTGTQLNARLTFRGYERVEELTRRQSISSQIFVAMWFDEMTKLGYENGIKPAIEAVGYTPLRIDDKEHSNKIDDEIIAEIRRSRCLVADFTCRPREARGGVYFEAGFAMGLNIPVVWTCHQDSLNDLHFDTRQYNHVVWDKPEDLRDKLKKRIAAQLGFGPLHKVQA